MYEPQIKTINELEDLIYKFLRSRTAVENIEIQIDKRHEKRLRVYSLVYPAVELKPGERIPVFNRYNKETTSLEWSNPHKICICFIDMDLNNVIKTISKAHMRKSDLYDSHGYDLDDYSDTDYKSILLASNILRNIKLAIQ